MFFLIVHTLTRQRYDFFLNYPNIFDISYDFLENLGDFRGKQERFR